MSLLGKIGHFIGACASAAGKAVGTVTHAISSGLHAVADLAGKIPIVGPAFRDVLDIAAGPFDLTDAIISGARIDEAVLSELKSEIANVKDLVPVAMTIVKLIPGINLAASGVGALIAGAKALADGQEIDEIFAAAIEEAIPYGQLAKAAYEATRAAINGANILDASYHAALNDLPPGAQAALETVRRAASGDNIPEAALEEARSHLPPEAQKGLDIGIAVGHGQKLQSIVLNEIEKQGPALLEKLITVGAEQVKNSDIYAAGSKLIDKSVASADEVMQGYETVGDISLQVRRAYSLGIGTLTYHSVSQAGILKIRNMLGSDDERTAFDMAMATKVGAVVMPYEEAKRYAEIVARSNVLASGLVTTAVKHEATDIAHILLEAENRQEAEGIARHFQDAYAEETAKAMAAYLMMNAMRDAEPEHKDNVMIVLNQTPVTATVVKSTSVKHHLTIRAIFDSVAQFLGLEHAP